MDNANKSGGSTLPSSSASETTREHISPYTLAAGLMWSDRILLLPWYGIVIVPDVLSVLQGGTDPFLVRVVSIFINLSFLWWVGRRHVSRLSRVPSIVNGWCKFLFFATGFAISLIPSLFLASLSIGISPNLQFLIVAIFIGATCLAYLYFFWFFPFQLGISSPLNAFSLARSFVTLDKKAPLKVLIAPAAIMWLVQGMLTIPAPDGRIIELLQLSSVFGGIYWVLSSYLGLAFGLSMLNDKQWHDVKLDSYRQSRFTTVAVASPSWLERSLKPSFGGQMLALCLLVWSANWIRLAGLAPAPTIHVEKIELSEARVSLTLQLHDSKYLYHGFRPAFLRLAGAQRTVVAPYPEQVSIQGEVSQESYLLELPHDRPDLVLNVDFNTPHEAEELSKAQDLYLWYGGVRIHLLAMDKATIIENAAPANQGVLPNQEHQSASSSEPLNPP